MAMRFVQLPVSILREGRRFVAYSPAVDLSSSGKTFAEARRHFAEATALFFEELERMDTLDETLSSLGWKKVERRWSPPVLVAQEQSQVRIPA